MKPLQSAPLQSEMRRNFGPPIKLDIGMDTWEVFNYIGNYIGNKVWQESVFIVFGLFLHPEIRRFNISVHGD
jgi:hypothetical protein